MLHGFGGRRDRIVLAALLPSLLLAFPVWLTSSSARAEGAAGRELVVMLPLNVEEVPAEFLADGTQVIDGVLARELERRGVPFVQLSLVEGLRRWSRATNAVGGLVVDLDGVEQESVDLARNHLITALLREYDAATVVWPDLRIRDARQRKWQLEWDGVSRRIPGRALARRTRSPARGSSLRIRIFDANADLVSDRHRGLEVIDSLRILRRDFSTREFWYRYAVRNDLFEDADILEAAAHGALPASLP